MEATTDSAPLRAVEAAYEVRMLDAILEHPLECQSPHRYTVCSVEVVAINVAVCEQPEFLVCQSVADWVEELKKTYAVCVCGALTAHCWKIIPI